MNNSTLNFTTPDTSTNSTADSVWFLEIMIICVFSTNVLCGLPTHFSVVWHIITGKGSGVASEFLNLNLSVCEIGICLNCLFYIVSVYFQSISKLLLFLLGLVFTARPLFHCLICVKRYLAVVHPVTFLKLKPLRYRVICCAVAWIITLGSCIFCLFIDYKTNNLLLSQFFSLQFLFALCIQLFCLVAVLRALKQSGPGERGRERTEENHMKRRAFQIILITTLSMNAIYLPFAITGIITVLTNQYNNILWITGLLSYVLAGFVQPVLYLHRAGKLSCLCV